MDIDDPDEQIALALAAFRDHPLPDGDGMVVLPDGHTVLELEGLCHDWDAEVCTGLASAITGAEMQRVVLGLARRRGATPADEQIWADLRRALPPEVRLDPLVVLPAAPIRRAHSARR